eukprot:jgi/Chlat1/4893/Chrsp31S04904
MVAAALDLGLVEIRPAAVGPRDSQHLRGSQLKLAPVGKVLVKHSGKPLALSSNRSRPGVVTCSTSSSTASTVPPSAVRVPRSIHDIDNGSANILGYGAELAADHPGYFDDEYKRRRMDIVANARSHKIGEPIPVVEYTQDEIRVWGQVLEQLTQLYPTHACTEFNRCFQMFDFKPDRIPQLQELSEVLMARTGFAIRPVGGLLRPRDFLNGLAFRTFHSTQYIRHASNPMYTPEPDVCHELLGHVPMLADPDFADVAHAIGVASLGASDKDIWHLTKVYWYTVEFGAVQEGADFKAFGAGLLSSYGELRHMLASPDVEFVELDPAGKLPKISYKDGYQLRYYYAKSFADLAIKLKAYAASLTKDSGLQLPSLSMPVLQVL